MEKPKYYMGVDVCGKNNLAYFLGRYARENGGFEIILEKTMRDQKHFEEEVANLRKYFDAKLIDENHFKDTSTQNSLPPQKQIESEQ